MPSHSTELLPRRLPALPLFVLASHLVEIEQREHDLRLAIADAEERGDPALAIQLRALRVAERAAIRESVRVSFLGR